MACSSLVPLLLYLPTSVAHSSDRRLSVQPSALARVPKVLSEPGNVLPRSSSPVAMWRRTTLQVKERFSSASIRKQYAFISVPLLGLQATARRATGLSKKHCYRTSQHQQFEVQSAAER